MILNDAWRLFCGAQAPDATVERLAQLSQRRALPRHHPLIEQEADAQTVYLVVSGRLKTVRYTKNGHEIWLSTMQPGDMIGEIGVLTDGVRSSGVVAETDVTLAVLSRTAFLDLIASDGVFMRAVMTMLAKRLAVTSAQLGDLVALPVAARLHAELIRIGTMVEADDEEFYVDPGVSVSTLAQRIHATREATSRALRQLEERGLVTRSDQSWRVIGPQF